MLVIYVKHYLNEDGLSYFREVWFPKVNAIISQQPGFISICHEMAKDQNDCVNILLKFENETTLNAWGEQAIHSDLVNALDPFRSRNYWEVVRTSKETIDESGLLWERIVPVNSLSE